MTEETKPADQAEEKAQTMVDMAEIASVVKSVVEKEAAGAVREAVKPFIEKGDGFANYADAILELERKKQELNTPPEKKGAIFGRYVRLCALGKGDWNRGIYEAKKHSAWGPDDAVVQSVTKVLTVGDPAGAGSVIPAAVAAEYIEFLRGLAVVRSVARVLPMPQGSLIFRKQTGAATSYYVGEESNVTPSEVTVGNVTLSFKKLVTLTPVSNSLLRLAGGDIDMMVRDDMALSQALREDTAFLTGDGDENTPLGITNRVAAANSNAAAGTTYANQISDYTNAVRRVEAANVPLTPSSGYWFVHPQVAWGMYRTVGATEDATSPFQAGLSMNPPQLLGYQVKKSTQPGTGTLFFVHGPSLLIGDSLSIDIGTFDGAAYYDGANVVSAVSRDETVIRAVAEHDFNMRHDLAASVITGSTVGA